MMKQSLLRYACLCVLGYAHLIAAWPLAADESPLNQGAAETAAEKMIVPAVSPGSPAAGKRVLMTAPEYRETDVFHTLYLPPRWSADGEPTPIIFEYTGNYFPQSGSSGKVEDGALGYGLSGGQFIWVSLPYVNSQHTANEVTWWGDERATVEYAKLNVPRIIEQFNADSDAVFLCGFSRGAIGVNYIGLYDDEISKLWTAFVTHDHFDGVRQWNTPWGSPLERYQENARKRLERVGNRPYWVSQNGSSSQSEQFIRSVYPNPEQFTFANINVPEILGSLPNEIAKSPHTDRWLLKPSPYRSDVWAWMKKVARENDSSTSAR